MIQQYFSEIFKFPLIKEGYLISWGEQILHNNWIIWSHLLYFNCKRFKDPNFSSFISFQYILHDSGDLFWDFWNFYKLKIGHLIS